MYHGHPGFKYRPICYILADFHQDLSTNQPIPSCPIPIPRLKTLIDMMSTPAHPEILRKTKVNELQKEKSY